MTTSTIIKRIVDNRAAYEARNAKKNKSEAEYYNKKQFIHEAWVSQLLDPHCKLAILLRPSNCQYIIYW